MIEPQQVGKGEMEPEYPSLIKQDQPCQQQHYIKFNMKNHQFGGGFKIKSQKSLRPQSSIKGGCMSVKRKQTMEILRGLQADQKEQDLLNLYTNIGQESTEIPEPQQNNRSFFNRINEQQVLNDNISKTLTSYLNKKQRPQTAVSKKIFDTERMLNQQKKKRDSSQDQLENVVDTLFKQQHHQQEEVEVEKKRGSTPQQVNLNLIKRSNSTRIHSRPMTAVGNKMRMERKTQVDSCEGIFRYAFQHTLGTGSYATVKQARDKLTEKQVAIKTYAKSRLCDPQKRQNLRREVYILKQMEHPNVIGLLNTIDTQTEYHLVMEYGGQISLRQHLKEQPSRRVCEDEARAIFREIVKGVDYCHKNNIIHRDIKLENILLTDQRNVKLIDFGFSVIVQNNTKLNNYCGTPSYMAPEIVSKHEYYAKPVDIWSLGVVLYAMVSGTFPFRGKDDVELYGNIKRGKYRQPVVSVGCQKLLASIFRIKGSERPTTYQILSDSWLQ